MLRSSYLERPVLPIVIQVFLHVSVNSVYLLPTMDVAIIIWRTGLRWIASTNTFIPSPYPTPARLDVSGRVAVPAARHSRP